MILQLFSTREVPWRRWKRLGGWGEGEDDFVFLKGFWVSWELDQSYTAGVPMWAWRMTHHGSNSVPSIMVLVVCTESFWPRAACGQAPQSTLSQPILNRTARDGSPLVLSPGKQEAMSQNAWLCSWWLRAHPIPSHPRAQEPPSKSGLRP